MARSISTKSLVRSAVDELLSTRHYQQYIDLEYRHNPETINIIVADELAALKQRRAEHQQNTGQEIQA